VSSGCRASLSHQWSSGDRSPKPENDRPASDWTVFLLLHEERGELSMVSSGILPAMSTQCVLRQA
jgi:hypothetical protein